MKYTISIISLLLCYAPVAPAGTDEWVVYKRETFDSPAILSNLDAFGDANWLTAEIRNDAIITVSNGMAHFLTVDFPGQALIRITDTLPDEYKIRVRLGGVNFGYTNYEADDYEDPNFHYSINRVENGFYWSILTDVKSEGENGEEFWHNHRKAGLDSDDHYSYGWHTERPVYFVYSPKTAYEDEPVVDTAYRPDGVLKSTYARTWLAGGPQWDSSPWSWEIGYTYDATSWYWTEIEKSNHAVTLRLYDGNMNLLEQAAPVCQELINNMGSTASPEEYFYVGEPHVNSYEGNAFVDEIIFYTPAEPSATSLLTVNSGYGGGTYEPDDVVCIMAMPATVDMEFDEWIGDTAWIADVAAARTTITMPEVGAAITARYASLYAGDLSDDGRVDIVDLNMVLIDWGKSGGFVDLRSDANGDGTVNLIDLNTVLIDWGKTGN